MNTTKNTTRWIAGLAIAAGLGAAMATGSAVGSADVGSVGPTAETPSHGTSDGQSERRRATFAGASVTEVKFDDLDADNNKKP